MTAEAEFTAGEFILTVVVRIVPDHITDGEAGGEATRPKPPSHTSGGGPLAAAPPRGVGALGARPGGGCGAWQHVTRRGGGRQVERGSLWLGAAVAGSARRPQTGRRHATQRLVARLGQPRGRHGPSRGCCSRRSRTRLAARGGVGRRAINTLAGAALPLLAKVRGGVLRRRS